VGGHPAVGVEHDGVGDVVLGRRLGDVLLERGEVVEEQGRLRGGGQSAGEHLTAALDLVDDGGPLAMLDDHHHRGHDDGDDQQRAPEQARAE
jgi:hypothetical protein